MTKTKTISKNGRRVADRQCHPVDLHVGARIKQRRVMMGISQDRLADAIGLTFQQVQKYEKGGNRISASKLWAIANVLDVPVSFFFDDMAEQIADAAPSVVGSLAGTGIDMMFGRQDLEMARVYRHLPQAQKKSLYAVARTLLDANGRASAGDLPAAAE